MSKLFEDLKEGLEEAIEVEKCDFCNKIYTKEEYDKIEWYDQPDCLIKDKDRYYIFSACDDWYYNHIVVDNVKYCPCCGRRLV